MVIIGDTILQGGATHIPLSGVTAYHLLEGSLALASTTPTSGFSTTLYTGNGSTQSINTGIDMATQWGNDVSEKFGGLVWIKGRSSATGNNLLDSVRSNFDEVIYTHSTSAGVQANVIDATSTGFNIGTVSDTNNSSVTYASWNFQTTHRVSGTTNHGKAYTCHYNPITGFTIVKYEGSGLVGHEIPHHLGRKLGFVTVKNLTSAVRWQSFTESHYMFLNETSAGTTPSSSTLLLSDNISTLQSANNETNASANQYIMYGWANSYFDEANKLIGNYEIGIYQGTGASGNKVKTRGKPAWVMTKRLDSTSNWIIVDNQRLNTGSINLVANTANAEPSVGYEFRYTFQENGFTTISDNVEYNASGGQYLYMVAYDNDSGSGKSKYPKPSDNPVINLTAKVPFANGVDVNGTKLSILSKNESISGVTLSQGKNYVYCDNTGAYGKSIHRPRYLASDLVRTYAGEQPDYFDVEKNKWFSCDVGSELVANGTFSDGTTTGWTLKEGNGTFTNVNGMGVLTYVSATTSYQYQLNLIVGKKYKLKLRIPTYTQASNYVQLYVTKSSNINDNYYYKVETSTLGLHEITFIAETTTAYIVPRIHGAGSISIDDITCFQVEITPTTEITESRNYMNHIVHADNDGGVLYVEELPKIEYKNVIKANEYKGKNACTAWAIIDGQTTPPTIRDGYGISSVIKTTTGKYELIPTEDFNNEFFSVTGTSGISTAEFKHLELQTKNRIKVQIWSGSSYVDASFSVQIFGGKK